MGGVQPDENLRFLYVCIKHSRGNEQIDWPAVAKTMNIQVAAARMRFRRLEEKIQTAMRKAGTDTDVPVAGAADGDGAGDTAKGEDVKKPRGNKRKKTTKETDGSD